MDQAGMTVRAAGRGVRSQIIPMRLLRLVDRPPCVKVGRRRPRVTETERAAREIKEFQADFLIRRFA